LPTAKIGPVTFLTSSDIHDGKSSVAELALSVPQFPLSDLMTSTAKPGRRIIMFTRQVPMLIVSMALVLLASCGGGGGGGIAAPPPAAPPPNTAALPITADNAQDITVSVLQAVTSTVEIVDIVDVVGIPVFSSSNPGMAKLPVREIFVQVLLCDTGEVTVTWNDADDNLEISTGDTFDIVFDMCFFADTGTTLDGATSLTNIVVSGDPVNQIAPWSLAITFGFDNLTGTDNTGTSIIDGGLDIDLSSDDNVVVNLAVATTSLTAQQSNISETLSNYVLTETFDLNALTQVISASGTLTSTLLEGNVTFETLQEFIVIGDDNPSAGQLLISDDSSSVLVTVIDNISIQLDIDLDLDGSIDQTIMVTWDELDIE
jgi:hypothetical protein